MAVDLSISVLVVDDYPTNVSIVTNLLKQIGFEHVDGAKNGAAALGKMRGKTYGLVISDWTREPTTGSRLLRDIRSDPVLAETPFLMLTAQSKTETVIAATAAGLSGYIVKPFNARMLQSRIEAVMAA